MKVVSALILAAGIYNLAFAAFHLFFWRLFGWPQQLRKLTPVNSGIMQILNLCLTYLFVVFAMICFWFPAELAATELGHFVLVALAVFWAARAIYQPMYFGLAHPLSIGLFALLVLGSAIHALAWWVAREAGV